jgi:glutathione synthase/RimK-type ligase-like ATP-grasp enzyme
VHVVLVTGSHGTSSLRDADALLVAALERRGAEVHAARWSDAEVDWSRFDVAVALGARDATDDRDGFVAWAARVGELAALWNPADVLRWNTHRSYLLELEDRGAPVVPTAWLARGDRIDLAELLASRGWSRAIVEPAVGAGSVGLAHVDVDAVAAGQRHLHALLVAGDAMVQPYLSSVESRGELSVIVIDGEVSHAVRRLPEPGGIRVQDEHVGHHLAEEPGRDTRDLARWMVEAVGTELLYARVDLLEDEVGALQLVGLEATAPDLYLDEVPESAERLADAILRRG